MAKITLEGGEISLFEEQDLVMLKAISPAKMNGDPVELSPEQAIKLGNLLIQMGEEIQKRENH